MQRQIIDNFLPAAEFKKIKDFVESTGFPWFYISHVSRPAGSEMPDKYAMETFGWYHDAYSKTENVRSFAVEHIESLFKALQDNAKTEIEIIRVRFGLKTYKKGFTEDNYNLPHVDYHFPHKTVIFYINTTDGDTRLFDQQFTEFPEPNEYTVQERINPIENRLLLIDGLQYHTASNPINNDNRIVININYIEKGDSNGTR